MSRYKFRAWSDYYKMMDEDESSEIFSKYPPDKIMQWTGFTDCNDVLLFEGDIIKMDYKDYKAEIVWAERPPQFYMKPLDEDQWIEDWNITDDCYKGKIIGNIHEGIKDG